MPDPNNETALVGSDTLRYLHQTLGDIADAWRRHREALETETPSGRVQETMRQIVAADEHPRRPPPGIPAWEKWLRLAQETARANREAATLLQSPAGQWEGLLAAKPERLRKQVLGALVYAAHCARDEGDSTRAYEIAAFTARCSAGAPNGTSGRAWLILAELHYVSGDLDAAKAACDEASVNLQHASDALDLAHAQHLRAKVWIAKGHRPAPIRLLSDCARSFVSCLDPETAIAALGLIAELLCEATLWEHAHDVLAVARLLAEADEGEDGDRSRELFDAAIRGCGERGYRQDILEPRGQRGR